MENIQLSIFVFILTHDIHIFRIFNYPSISISAHLNEIGSQLFRIAQVGNIVAKTFVFTYIKTRNRFSSDYVRPIYMSAGTVLVKGTRSVRDPKKYIRICKTRTSIFRASSRLFCKTQA